MAQGITARATGHEQWQGGAGLWLAATGHEQWQRGAGLWLTEEERFWQTCVDLCLQAHFYNKECYPFLPRTEHERQAFEEFYSNPANVPEKTVPRRGPGRTPAPGVFC